MPMRSLLGSMLMSSMVSVRNARPVSLGRRVHAGDEQGEARTAIPGLQGDFAPVIVGEDGWRCGCVEGSGAIAAGGEDAHAEDWCGAWRRRPG